jgi:hypothetical protein
MFLFYLATIAMNQNEHFFGYIDCQGHSSPQIETIVLRTIIKYSSFKGFYLLEIR